MKVSAQVNIWKFTRGKLGDAPSQASLLHDSVNRRSSCDLISVLLKERKAGLTQYLFPSTRDAIQLALSMEFTAPLIEADQARRSCANPRNVSTHSFPTG